MIKDSPNNANLLALIKQVEVFINVVADCTDDIDPNIKSVLH